MAYELNKRGVPTVHCTVIHDSDGKVYENAKNTVEAMLKIYPSIEYVIDLNRLDVADEKGRVVRTLSALETAQIRVTVSSDGILVRDTLALALSLRRDMNGDGKNLCMPVVFTDSSYCAELSLYYLKVDVGSYGNSAEEAVSAGALLAETLAGILKK